MIANRAVIVNHAGSSVIVWVFGFPASGPGWPSIINGSVKFDLCRQILQQNDFCLLTFSQGKAGHAVKSQSLNLNPTEILQRHLKLINSY